MRDSDMNDPVPMELGHVHERLKKLEDGQGEMQKTLVAMQLKLAEGWRFPATGWGAVLVIVGALAATYLKVETGSANALKALQLIEEHLAHAPVHREMVHQLGELTTEWLPKWVRLEEQVGKLSGQIVGNSAEGWHRRDHNLYAEGLDHRLRAIEGRLSIEEERSKARDALWDRVQQRGLLGEKR